MAKWSSWDPTQTQPLPGTTPLLPSHRGHNPQGRLGEETSGVDMELKSSYLLGSEEGTWLLW